MKCIATQSSPKSKGQCLIVFSSFSKGKDKKNKINTSGLNKSLSALLNDAFNEESFKANKNETTLYRNIDELGAKHIIAVGLGDKSNVTPENYRQAATAALKKARQKKFFDIAFHMESAHGHFKKKEEIAQALSEGSHLGLYQFNDHMNKKKEKDFSEIHFLYPAKGSIKSAKKAIEEGEILAGAVNFSKWLADKPGNYMTPSILAKETVKEAKGSKLKVTVWDKARIKKEKMGGLMGVSLGSSEDPRFIIMEYKGAAASKKPVCFVGKGLTFDSGGISLKPGAGMDEMKYDMCGGANVIGAMMAIAKLKLKVNAIAFVPSTENMPGASACKPGDVLTARNGKTVEVLNTDAEGRLILMDALSYASEKKPAVIFDAATLTGAMVMALGNSYTGVFSRDEKLVNRVKKAASKTEEQVWPMPIHDHHTVDMKGKHAELSNLSGFRGAGSSTAAAFLEQFVDKDIPWAHFDIAGTAWNCGNRLNYCAPKGATGCMVRSFVEVAKSYF